MSTAGEQERLLEEVAGLGVEEILAVCYAFHNQKVDQVLQRLRLYLDVLRRRGGERAQFASCLICFDLARQGDPTAQREFAYLADTIRFLAQRGGLVEALLGGDPYLLYIWELCQEQLAEADPRFATAGAPEHADTAAELATLDLLSDADFDDAGDFDIAVDDGALWLRFDEAVEAFLGGEVGIPTYDPEAGFRLHHNRDVERIERFLMELDSLREPVPPARGFRALALLFYGTHMRSKSLFGAKNERKEGLLRAGIAEFFQSAEQVWEVIGVLQPMHADDDAWEKMADVLSDFLCWAAEHPDLFLVGPSAFDVIERLVHRDLSRGSRKTYGRQ